MVAEIVAECGLRKFALKNLSLFVLTVIIIAIYSLFLMNIIADAESDFFGQLLGYPHGQQGTGW